MDNGRWEEPITFETQRLGQYRTIASAAEAARALVEDWPVDTGNALAEARETCLAVLEGRKKPAARHSLGLSAEGFARWVNVSNGKTVRRWESGERDIPGPVQVLTKAALDSAAVRKYFGLSLSDGSAAADKKPRGHI